MVRLNGNGYLGVLRALRDLIAHDYAEGGWLPSSRMMAAQLDSNRITYRKALRCLEQDNTIRAHAKKGHYVNPSFLRAQKIGLAVDNGGDSPFVRSRFLEGVLEIISANGFSVQIVQASSHEGIEDKALVHGILGLIWLFPSSHALRCIEAMSCRGTLPVLGIVPHERPESASLATPLVEIDLRQHAIEQADFFIQRGHRRVAYVARTKGKGSGYSHFSRRMKNAGCDTIFLKQDPYGQEADLSPLAKDSTTTGLVVGGGSWDIYRVFSNLTMLTRHHLTDLYVSSTPELATIQARHPVVQVTAIGETDYRAFANRAATLFMDHVTHKAPFLSTKVSAFRIRKVLHP